MDIIITDPGQWGLPEIGTDWVEGFEDCYLIMNPMLCSDGLLSYWGHNLVRCDCHSTGDAGVFSGTQVRKYIHTLNNGLTHVAIPCTWTAFKIVARLDFNDEHAFDLFASVQYCVL